MLKIIYRLFFICLISLSSTAYSAEYFYGPTAENEHLYRIALRVNPTPQATVQQVMIAILHANPAAFSHNNINGLKSGYRLRLPSSDDVMRISPYYALHIVDQQNFQWRRGVFPIHNTFIKMTPRNTKHHKNKIVSEADSIPSIANLKMENKQPTTKNSTQDLINKTEKTTSKTSVLDLVKQQKASSNLKQSDEVAPIQVTSANNESTVKENSAVVNNFMNDTKKFEEQANTQIASLQQQTKVLQATVNQLNSELQTLTYHFVQLTTQNPQHNKNYLALLLNGIKQNVVGLSSAILALVLLSYLLIRSFRPKRIIAGNNRKDEYDFMNSQESIPSKLDLARAYIDMGDFSSAEKALREVMAKGTEEQQKGARDLLGKINLQ